MGKTESCMCIFTPPLQAGKTWVEKGLSQEDKNTESFNYALAIMWSSKASREGAMPS
jgi:hypothetical protein